MSRGGNVRQVIVVALAVVALFATLLGLTGWIRIVLTFPFVLIGPGLAITTGLRLRDPLTEVGLLVPVSLAIQTLLATLLVYLSAYEPPLVLAGSVIVALGGLAVDAHVSAAPSRAIEPGA